MKITRYLTDGDLELVVLFDDGTICVGDEKAATVINADGTIQQNWWKETPSGLYWGFIQQGAAIAAPGIIEESLTEAQRDAVYDVGHYRKPNEKTTAAARFLISTLSQQAKGQQDSHPSRYSLLPDNQPGDKDMSDNNDAIAAHYCRRRNAIAAKYCLTEIKRNQQSYDLFGVPHKSITSDPHYDSAGVLLLDKFERQATKYRGGSFVDDGESICLWAKSPAVVLTDTKSLAWRIQKRINNSGKALFHPGWLPYGKRPWQTIRIQNPNPNPYLVSDSEWLWLISIKPGLSTRGLRTYDFFVGEQRPDGSGQVGISAEVKRDQSYGLPHHYVTNQQRLDKLINDINAYVDKLKAVRAAYEAAGLAEVSSVPRAKERQLWHGPTNQEQRMFTTINKGILFCDGKDGIPLEHIEVATGKQTATTTELFVRGHCQYAGTWMPFAGGITISEQLFPGSDEETHDDPEHDLKVFGKTEIGFADDLAIAVVLCLEQRSDILEQELTRILDGLSS